MGLLPWSFGFLLIISVLTWSAVGRMSEETLVARSIVGSVQRQAEELTKKIGAKSSAAYKLYCEKNGKKAPDIDEEDEEEGDLEDKKIPRFQKARHRLTSKLHVPALFSNEDAGQKETQEKIFRSLLRELYADQHLFIAQGSNDAHVQQLFDEVRAKAIEWGPKLPMNNASNLANIELSGQKKEERQFIFFLILKGGDGEFFRGNRCHVQPLLSYISMNKKEFCMNVYLAPVPLLTALFESKDVAAKIAEYRKTVFEKIRKEKDSDSALDGDKEKKPLLDILSEEFKSQFESSIPSGIDPQYIDFHVSGTKPKDYL
jgi:hypothetical protein